MGYKWLADRVYEKDGTLFMSEDGEYVPLRFNVHDGGGAGPDGDMLSHENLQCCGYEVGDDSNRHFRSAVCLPSDCFIQDIEQDRSLTDDEIAAIKEWAEADLEIANEETSDYIKPMEREAIKDMFDNWLDDQRREYAMSDDEDERSDDEKIQDFIYEEEADYPFFWYHTVSRGLVQFHDEDEVAEICRNYLAKED